MILNAEKNPAKDLLVLSILPIFKYKVKIKNMSENQKIHQKLGPAFMYTTEVVGWLSGKGLYKMANKVLDHAGENLTISVQILKEILYKEDVRSGIVIRQLQSDVCQYQNFA